MNKILSIIIVIAFLILAASFIHAQTIIYVVSEEETPASTQTSALSSEQTVTITLNGGYNFISLPVTPDDTGIETVIASIKDKLDRIWYYDASIDKWSFYNPDPIFSSANNLLTLEPGKGYQFNMKQAATLKVIGMPYEFQPITLEANKWHMIGTFFSDVALSNILGSCSLENIEISTIDREGNNVPIAKSPSTLLESKKGYNIKSTNNCVLEEILDVSDTVTTTTTENRCSECGDGFFNFCDDDECKALGNCEFTDECREIISVDIPANLCNNQGGALCEKYEVCRGTVLSASDTNRCCLGECKLPNSFDWRNRHGENWNSPVKNQGSVSSCTSFGAIAAIEATINLYYNQHLDIDLSEQATLSCGSTLYQEAILNEDGHGDFNSAPAGDCFGVNSPASNLCRAKVVGFVDEQCYPYVDHFTPSTFVCDNLCSDYQNRLWKVTDFFQLLSDGAYTNFVVDDNNNVFYEGPLLDRLRQEHLSEEELKKAIIKYGPVGASSVVPGHTASIVGWENTDYELIEQCDANEFCTDSSCNTICTPGEIICKNIHYSNEDWSLVKGTKLKCSETGDGLEPAWESGDYFCTDEELCYRGECVPKKSVKEGEILCVGETLGENTKVNRYSYKPSEGETRWIYKNSGGTSIGEQGYGKVVKNAEEFGVVGVVKTPIIPPPNKNYEINCEDKDNDNFCNWGISENKPSTCPASCKPE
ncbi:MAG: C1 family peptidase, partial [Flavobacteriales bacterium]|nr:C1 family peptidase [Flavobacteriales bacterium]